MTCAVILAETQDKEFFDKLTDLTRSHFSPLCCWKGEISHHGDSSGLLITDYESFGHIDLSPKIIIYGGKGRYDLSQVTTKQTVVIVDSCASAQLGYVSSTKLPAITCGLFAKDTITLSSMTADSAVINLQRSIRCFSGEIAEPQEIPVRFMSAPDSYLLMAVAAIFILTGNSDRLTANSLELH